MNASYLNFITKKLLYYINDKYFKFIKRKKNIKNLIASISKAINIIKTRANTRFIKLVICSLVKMKSFFWIEREKKNTYTGNFLEQNK